MMCFHARPARPLTHLLAAIAVLALSPVFAGGVADSVTVTDPYVRAVPPVVKTSAAFMQLLYRGDEEQFLVDARTPAAGAVELHMHETDGGVMRMRRIPHIHLPPGQPVSLQPGGLHLMLFDLQETLAPGDSVPITLIFADGSAKTVDAEVRPVHRMMQH
jgi:copper(I)-binding protein